MFAGHGSVNRRRGEHTTRVRSRSQSKTARLATAGGARSAYRVRRAGHQERVDNRRRRLGLRHWLRRAGSRAGERAERQRAGAGHRGLFKHRRTSLEGNSDGRGREVRGGRKVYRKKGSRLDGYELWQCLRCQSGDGRQRHSHAEGVH